MVYQLVYQKLLHQKIVSNISITQLGLKKNTQNSLSLKHIVPCIQYGSCAPFKVSQSPQQKAHHSLPSFYRCMVGREGQNFKGRISCCLIESLRFRSEQSCLPSLVHLWIVISFLNFSPLSDYFHSKKIKNLKKKTKTE